MSFSTILTLVQTALELGLICSVTVLALFLSYSMLNVCDLSTDGCFTFGATVGAAVAIAGHPYLALPAAMAAGMLSGFCTALLQTKMGVNSLLSGIIVNTALYSVNIAVMGGSSVLNMNKTATVFTKMRALLEGTALQGQSRLIVAALAAAADGVSTIRGTSRLLHKESNRAEAIREEYAKVGIEVDISEEDVMRIRGGKIRPARVSSHDDHRMAMSMAVSALRCDGQITIENAECVAKSYPGFFEDLEKIRV